LENVATYGQYVTVTFSDPEKVGKLGPAPDLTFQGLAVVLNEIVPAHPDQVVLLAVTLTVFTPFAMSKVKVVVPSCWL